MDLKPTEQGLCSKIKKMPTEQKNISVMPNEQVYYPLKKMPTEQKNISVMPNEQVYYPQSSTGMPNDQGLFPINLRRRKERDKVSEVWKTFYVSPIEPNSVVCRLCSVTLSYVGGSTSGMRNHLQNKHRHIIPKAFSSPASGSSESSYRRSGGSVINPLSSSRFSSGGSYQIPYTSPPPPPTQSQFNHSSSSSYHFPATSTQNNNSSSSPTCLSPPSPYAANGENSAALASTRLAREVAVMCATDLLSPTLVDGKGFHRIFRLLNGSSQSSDLSSVTTQAVRSAMKDLQFSLRLKIQRQLSSSARLPNGEYKKDESPKRRPVSLILCPWSQINAPSSNEFWDTDVNSPVINLSGFVDVRAQFLGDDWHPESRLLGTLPHPTISTGTTKMELESAAKALAVAIHNLISDTYELIDAQIVACVFPKCSLLDACVGSLGWLSVPCVARILDNVIENAFNSSCDVNYTKTVDAKSVVDKKNCSTVAVDGVMRETVANMIASSSSLLTKNSSVKTKVGEVKDIVAVGLELWKSAKKAKHKKPDGNELASHENENGLPLCAGGILENVHNLSDKEIESSVFDMRRGRWRTWCRLLEQLSELANVNAKDPRYADWKQNMASLVPTVIRLSTAWEALSSNSNGTSGSSDDIPLLSCALPILCSLPFCPSGDSGGSDNSNENSPLSHLDEESAACNESTEEAMEKAVHAKIKEQDSEVDCSTIGVLVRQKLKTSLDAVLGIGKNEELKGVALLMAMASFVDPRHKALLFLSAIQREEVQQEVLRQMSTEECVVMSSEQKSIGEPLKSGDKRKKSSSLGSVNNSYCKRSKLEDLLHGVFGYSTAPDFTDISHEIEHYIGEPIAPLSQVPGIWWRQRESKYPHLSQMARRLLTIPASVSSGRGGMSTLHLLSQDITSILFLHSNLTVSDLEEMGFEVDGEEEGWRVKRGEEEGERDDGMIDVREDETKDYDESGRVVDEEQFYELETVCREPTHIIKVEPLCLND